MFARKTSSAGFFVNSLGIRCAIASGMMQRWFSQKPNTSESELIPRGGAPPIPSGFPYT
jgi:hypothetical protein